MPRRGENIYKRKDGRWEGRYIEGYNILGKAQYRSVYAHTYNDVKTKVKNRSAPKVVRSSMSVSDWIQQYIMLQKEKIKITTFNVYKRYLDNHIKPFFKDIQLRKLNREQLQRFIDSKYSLSSSTVRGIYSLIHESLKAAYDEGYVGAVWQGLHLPKNKTTQVKVFTREEQKMIENALDIKKEQSEVGILLCLYTGLRIGELCGLKWEDIDFHSNVLTVRRTAQRVQIDGKSVLKELPPKSNSSCRNIPIPSFMMPILKEIYETADSQYVISINSSMMDPRTYQNRYKKVLKRAGVNYANFHVLRHTFSVRALELGFDIKTLSEILGHCNASVTLKSYAHSLDEHKKSSMEKLCIIWNKS